METLAKRLKAKREAAGLSQSQLADKAKIKNQSIIGMLESGARKTSSHIPKIANALGVESLWLSSGTGPVTREDAKLYEFSEIGIKVGLLVSKMPPGRQVALYDYLSSLEAKQEGEALIESQKHQGKNRLLG